MSPQVLLFIAFGLVHILTCTSMANWCSLARIGFTTWVCTAITHALIDNCAGVWFYMTDGFSGTYLAIMDYHGVWGYHIHTAMRSF
jgi:hypothetical protein